MPAISVQVGAEEKEISGLNRKTTCAEVIEALLNDKQTEVLADRENSQEVPECASDTANSKNLQELAKNYVIVENWRGCEKPLPSQTRILSVWRAWGKEQCHVRFSLKKDKSSRFRVGRYKEEFPDGDTSFIHPENIEQETDASHYIHKLSHGQKKRIRRSLMQYQRAVLNQRSQEGIDGNNNAGKKHRSRRGNRVDGDRSLSSREKSTTGPMDRITLSEEQFVDGVVTGPECVLWHDEKNKFRRNISDKQFNKERCTYRRPHHRRLSLLQEDSDGVTDQNVILSHPIKNDLHRNFYCSDSKKHSRSKHRSRHRSSHGNKTSRNQRKHRLVGSTDSNTSTASASVSSDEEYKSYSEGEDADDEKSVMADFNTSVSRQKLTEYAQSLLPCVETYSSGTASPSTATITDSSSATTTCSETSNTSGCSFTTSSSETSSTAELESYYARRDAAEAAKANANEKPKSGAARLFRIAKPAQSIIGSFKRKKRTPATQQNPTSTRAVQGPLPYSHLISKQQDNVKSDTYQASPANTTQQLSKKPIESFSNQPSEPPRKLTEGELLNYIIARLSNASNCEVIINGWLVLSFI